jgi:signal transduction histidine kinase
MKWISFRLKIIGTLIIVISGFSLLSFTGFYFAIKNRLDANEKEIVRQYSLVKESYYFTISQHDGRIIKSLLKSMVEDNEVLRAYLVNSASEVVYPADYKYLSTDTNHLNEIYLFDEDISVKSYLNEPEPYSRVFIKMQNSPSCYQCHGTTPKNLGMIIYDLINDEPQKIRSIIKWYSLVYTILLILVIFLFVLYLHYKYIKTSLSQFRSTIITINKGNLDARLSIPETRELGDLGKSFNAMLDNFERTQNELTLYHQKELKDSQRLATIGEMSARIAHEIRNPITGIASALEIIVADLKDDRNKPILEEIQRQASRVNRAISNLLRFSRTKDINLQEGNLIEIIQSLVFFLQNQSHDKKVVFKLDPHPDIPLIRFDHELIENVLLNLSLNAIKYSPDNGTITYRIATDHSHDNVIISVSDTGAGIPEEIESEIFKPFFTTDTKGTGLGLAISKEIIDNHKGEIWFKNQPGTGCTFFISLPATPELDVHNH